MIECCSSCHEDSDAGYQDFPVCCRLNHRHEWRGRIHVVNGENRGPYCYCGYDEDDEIHTPNNAATWQEHDLLVRANARQQNRTSGQP